LGGLMYGLAMAMKRKRAKELLTEVIGLTMNDATRRIKEAYLDVRVLSIGNVMCTNDGSFDPNRIGIVVVDGYVRGAQIG
jgi:hypothetical protein